MPIVTISHVHMYSGRLQTYSTYYSEFPTFRRNQINRKRENQYVRLSFRKDAAKL